MPNKPPENEPPPDTASGQANLWSELKRRHVVRVAMVYAVVGWLIIQIASATFSGFDIPVWAFRFVVLMVLLGFPVSLIIAWAFELTPQGIKTTKAVNTKKTDPAEASTIRKKSGWYAVIFAAAIPTLIFGAMAIFFYLRSSPASSGTPEPTTTRVQDASDNSIAVMPLSNMSSDEENAYFAGGVHEDILTNLSRIKDLNVVSRTTMLRYAASEMTLPEIGQALNVHYIVEGSVRRIGKHVRVTVQLIDARNDHHLWANNYERELVDVFATQSEVAKEISDSLHLEIQPDTVGRLENMPTSSVRAYDLYIKSISIEKSEGETEASTIRRRNMLEEAVKEDPDFVEAWALLKRIYDLMRNRVENKDWYLTDGVKKETVVAELAEKSQRALTKAMTLDPENVESLLAQAVDHAWPQTAYTMDQRRKILDHVIEKYPENAMAWYHLGWWYTHLSPPDTKAMFNAFEEALKRDPFNARIVYAVLERYRLSGDEKNIARLVDRLTQILPETTDERRMTLLAPTSRKFQIIQSFVESADESVVEEYAKLLKNDTVSITVLQDDDDHILQIFQNNQNRLLQLAENNSVPSYYGSYTFYSFIDINYTALCVHWLRGNSDKAADIAHRLIKAANDPKSRELVKSSPDIQSALVAAYSVLGEKEKAREYSTQILEKRSETFDPYGHEGFKALMWVDPDQAAEKVLSEMETHPQSRILDWNAAYHTGLPGKAREVDQLPGQACSRVCEIRGSQ
jgi:TolB-like protein